MIRMRAGGELALDERKHGGELGEKEDAAPLGEEGFEEFEEVVEFGRLVGFSDLAGWEFEEGGVAADLTEL